MTGSAWDVFYLGDYSSAFGLDSLAYGQYSFAAGNQNAAIGIASFAVGQMNVTRGDYSNISGLNNISNGCYSSAHGLGLISQSYGSFVIGHYNSIIEVGTEDGFEIDPNTPNQIDPIFIIANGTDENTRSNALTALRNGNVGIGTDKPSSALEVIGGTKLMGDVFVQGNVTLNVQGDISMGAFTAEQ